MHAHALGSCSARDLLQQSLTLPVRDSEWQITITTGTPQSYIVPGNPFETFVTLTAPGINDNTPPTVSVSLSPCSTGDVTSNSSDGSFGSTVSGASSLVPWSDSGVSSAPSGTAGVFTRTQIMTLPTVGHYCLGAYAVDPYGTRVAASIRIGATADEWRQGPLTGVPVMRPHIIAPPVPADGWTGGYRPGDTVLMNWHSPFESGTALVLWGHRAVGVSAFYHSPLSL